MRKLRQVVACVLLCAGVIAGCGGEDDATSTARCEAPGFEDMNASDPGCGKLAPMSHPDDLSIREVRLLDYTVRYYLYAEPMSENWMPLGTDKPKIQRYQFIHPTVVRLNNYDIVALTVSDVCRVTLWEEGLSAKSGCSPHGLQSSVKITADEAAVIYTPEAVAWMTTTAKDAGRDIMFTVSCLTRDEIQPDGSVSNGSPGCLT